MKGVSGGRDASGGTFAAGVGGGKMTSMFEEGLRDWIGVTRIGWGGGLLRPTLGGGVARAEFGACRSPPTFCHIC